MQIQSIAQQLLSPLSLDRSLGAATESNTATSKADSRANELGLVGNGEFHEILAKYDVTQMTPREFSELVQQLHEAGAIGDADLRELSKMRLQLEQSGASPDQPLNLLDFFHTNLENKRTEFDKFAARSRPDQADALRGEEFTAEARKQLDWVRKFALVQDAGAAGLDLGA